MVLNSNRRSYARDRSDNVGGSRRGSGKKEFVSWLVHSVALVVFLVIVFHDSYAVGYYMFPENSEDCGISLFYTHRESRDRGRGRDLLQDDDGKLTLSTNNGSGLLFSSGSKRRSSKLLENKSKRGSRRGRSLRSQDGKDEINPPQSRRSRGNSRVMKWKSKNPADLEGPLARIVGGTVAQPYAWPWQISLQLRHPTMGFIGHWCGGVLIGNQWVLTAGHCVNNRLFGLNQRGVSWFVLAGEYDRSKTEGTEKMIGVSRVFVHERFRDFDNDIALVKLSRPIQWSPTVSPVCLPNDDVPTLSFNMTGLKCVATGWEWRILKGDYLRRSKK